MNMYTHKHHIIPKHAGGSDDPNNLVELTVEDHAIAHYVRYKIYGDWQDELAWRGLSFRMSKEEIVREAASKATKGKTYEEIHGVEKAKQLKQLRAQSLIKNRKGKSWEQIFGEEKAEQRKKSASERRKRLNGPHSELTKEKMRQKKTGKKQSRCSCIQCHKEVSINNLTNHYKSH
jgi:hypothetical protein